MTGAPDVLDTPAAGPPMKATPLTLVTIPATAFCSCGSTARLAPLVNPGRNSPKPSDATAKLSVIV